MDLIGSLDILAETSKESSAARFLDRTAFVFLILMVIFAPHSIAATQTAWLIGMLAWMIRLTLRPRPGIKAGNLGLLLCAFALWSALSSYASYEPEISMDKLRNVAVLLIFFFVFNLVKNRRAVHFLAFLLIGSCMISVLWTPIQKVVGRGVEVHGLMNGGPLEKHGVKDGDTLLKANGRKVWTPADVIAELEASGKVRLDVYRTDAPFAVEFESGDLGGGASDLERLGATAWNRSSNFRASGFYGHYTTYAEVLQLIGSLLAGLFIAGYSQRIDRRSLAVFGAGIAGFLLALFLTVTRASQLAFLVSSGVVVILGAGRKAALLALAAAVPLSAAGVIWLQYQRNVGFLDSSDGSIQYRQMMWRDGKRLFTENPHNIIFGVGMDSIKARWQEWHLFDNGFQPMGHFHSTPVQIAVERGLPALLLWFAILGVYARSLWRGLKRVENSDWRSRGILLGCLGGLIGFFSSGLVHYNLGDEEVAMMFYLIMGIGMRLAAAEDGLIPPDSRILADEPDASPDSSDKRIRS